MRLAFFGSSEFALPTLKRLADSDHEIVCIYTQPPRPHGRKLKVRPTPVYAFATETGVIPATPTNLREPSEHQRIQDLALDAAIVIAYGLRIPASLLTIPRLGFHNLHASLLPRWRGAAPVQRAILAGDLNSGITFMKVDEGLDTGPIGTQFTVGITPRDTTGNLTSRLAEAGAQRILSYLEDLQNNTIAFIPQDPVLATHAAKVTPSEAELHFGLPRQKVERHIRAMDPRPGAFCHLMIAGRARRVIVRTASMATIHRKLAIGEFATDGGLLVGCADGALSLDVVHPAGSRTMPAEEFLRGLPAQPAISLVAPESDRYSGFQSQSASPDVPRAAKDAHAPPTHSRC